MERRHPTRHILSANVFQPIEYAVTVVGLKGWAGDSIVCSRFVEMAVWCMSIMMNVTVKKGHHSVCRHLHLHRSNM
jgi:hypothetical protein